MFNSYHVMRQISGSYIDIDMYIDIHPNITVHAVVHFQCSKTIFSVKKCEDIVLHFIDWKASCIVSYVYPFI